MNIKRKMKQCINEDINPVKIVVNVVKIVVNKCSQNSCYCMFLYDCMPMTQLRQQTAIDNFNLKFVWIPKRRTLYN